jgi:hypothetical protein
MENKERREHYRQLNQSFLSKVGRAGYQKRKASTFSALWATLRLTA